MSFCFKCVFEGGGSKDGRTFTSEKVLPLKVSLKPFQILAGIDSVHDLPPSPLNSYRHWKNEVFPLKVLPRF